MLATDQHMGAVGLDPFVVQFALGDGQDLSRRTSAFCCRAK
jgi:hypothetical protein